MLTKPFLMKPHRLRKKKMIVNCLINRVDVFRGYDLHIDFNINYQQFLQGLDCIEAA